MERLITLVSTLKAGRNTPILEDNPVASMDNLGKNLFESGYSYPPIWEIQGPLLAALSTTFAGPHKFMDIGPGSGNDTISMICANPKSLIVSVDIHKNQKAQLIQRVRNHLDKNALKKFILFCHDFSVEGSVPNKYVGKFTCINLNKVPHFLNKKQTETMFENVASLLGNEEGGLVFTTVSYPPPFAIKAFEQRKRLMNNVPGPIYYDAVKTLYQQPVAYEVLPLGQKGLPKTPGHKIERLEKRGNKNFLVIRQGRHFHDLETLSLYLEPYFDVLDSTIVEASDGEYFLSVIAQKKRT
ncbi:MAG: hypothetical protein GY915_01095 [bacterium]|nr:hypothetical protein [bacterium]